MFDGLQHCIVPPLLHTELGSLRTVLAPRAEDEKSGRIRVMTAMVRVLDNMLLVSGILVVGGTVNEKRAFVLLLYLLPGYTLYIPPPTLVYRKQDKTC